MTRASCQSGDRPLGRASRPAGRHGRRDVADPRVLCPGHGRRLDLGLFHPGMLSHRHVTSDVTAPIRVRLAVVRGDTSARRRGAEPPPGSLLARSPLWGPGRHRKPRTCVASLRTGYGLTRSNDTRTGPMENLQPYSASGGQRQGVDPGHRAPDPRSPKLFGCCDGSQGSLVGTWRRRPWLQGVRNSLRDRIDVPMRSTSAAELDDHPRSSGRRRGLARVPTRLHPTVRRASCIS